MHRDSLLFDPCNSPSLPYLLWLGFVSLVSLASYCVNLFPSRGAYLEEAQVYAVVSEGSIVQPFNVSVKDTLESPHNISCKISNCKV